MIGIVRLCKNLFNFVPSARFGFCHRFGEVYVMKTSSMKILVLSLLAGVVIASCILTWTSRHLKQKLFQRIDGSDIYLTGQIHPGDFQQISRLRVATIVDIRPDGEALDQMSSTQVAKLARQSGIDFAYIPVPHGAIPSSQVDKLASVLMVGKRPMLLYCRTGKRAIRTYCLAEASRSGGHTETELRSIAKKSGFSIDDLHDDIVRRISARRMK